MLRHALVIAFLAALAPAELATAQVALEWDRDLQIAAPQRLYMGRAHANPNGGWYVSGSRTVFFQQPGNPGYWVEDSPLLLRLDAQGQTTALQDLAPSGTNPSVPRLAVDAAGGLVAGLTGTGASILRLDALGAPQWSAPVPASIPELAHVGFAPNGDVLAGAFAINGSPMFGVASWSPSGAPGFVQSTPVSSATGAVFAISSTGSIAVAAGNFFVPLTIKVYGPTGNLAWSSTGVTGFEPGALAFTPSGDLVLAGSQYVGLTGRRAFVTKWSTTGVQAWTYAETGYALSRLEALAISPAGDVAVVGDAFPAIPGTQDALLISFDASGANRWTRTWSATPGNFQDWFHGVCFRASGEIVAGGRAHLNDPGDDTLLQAAPAVTCWSRDGVLAWQYLATSLHNDETCTSITETPSGSIVYSSRSTTYTPFSQDPAGGRFLSLRPQAIAFCFGDGSGTQCPCANHAAPGSGRGCLGSFGQAGLLASSGAASVSNDSLVLRGSGMPAMSSALYFQGTTRQNGGAGTVFGDGKLCAGGTITRLGSRANSGGASQYPTGGGAPIHVTGGVSVGDVRTYQLWYRNSATFCTVAPFNLTNGIEITWGS